MEEVPPSTTDSDFPSNMNQNFWKSIFSQTVSGAIRRIGPGDMVTSLDFVSQILRTHSEYGNQKGSQILKAVNDMRKNKDNPAYPIKPRDQWVEDVTHLYLPDRVKDFHGRLFIIGLALIDKPLQYLLYTDSFLADLFDELKDDLLNLLTDEGKTLYFGLSGIDMSAQDDYLQNNDDNPLTKDTEDGLDRARFAGFIVQLLNKTSLKAGAFSVHLYAPWGAGKTSFMNFMKQFLLKEPTKGSEQPKWYPIDFNAWQNQSLPYPWWNFMNTIYAQLKTKLPWRHRLAEWFWRFKAKRLNQALALLLVCFLLLYFGDRTLKGTSAWFDTFNKLLAALAGIWAIAISLSQNLARSSQKAAQNYLDSKDNPMADYKQKFNRLITALAPARIVIFIDDLDRCKSGYVVELLESIQTLFKESNVLFVVAADMTWLHASYEVEYAQIKGFVHVEGKTIGPLFIEKMFQLSVALPGVPNHIKEQCWANMLGIKPLAPEDDPAGFEAEAEAAKKEVNDAFQRDHDYRLDKLDKLASQENMTKTEHYLRPFGRFIDLNPRNMKRLLNSYLINKASSLISHIDIEKPQLVLYTILSIQWPVLASYLVKNPECLHDQSDLPDDIRELMQLDQVKAVLEGRGLNAPLTENTLVLCGLLFNCVNYSHYAPRKTAKPAREKPAKKQTIK